MTLAREYSVGRTSVNVVRDSADSTAALVFCGKELRRVKLLSDSNSLEHSSSPIWLTSREEVRASNVPHPCYLLISRQPSYQQPSINGVARIEGSPFLQDVGLSGSLVCVTDEQILISSFMLRSQAIPRRLETQGDPQRLTYSRHLNKLVIATDHVSFDGGGTLREPLMKRSLRPALQFIDPDAQASSASLVQAKPILIGDPGEQIKCIINWTPSDGKKHYEMFVVGTEIEAPDTSDCSGRLLCISAKVVKGNSSLDVKTKYVKKYPGQPIYSMCPYDKSSLLLCAGNDLVMLRLDLVTRKWAQVSTFILPSSATALTTRGTLIYATTMYHSLEILECVAGRIVMRSTDLRARNANSVVVCDNGIAIVSSTSTKEKGGRITGFSLRSDSKESQVNFHAALPLMVNHLRPGFTLPPDHSTHHCVYASTIDGTLYYLTTLSREEWQLLHFVESLIQEGRHDSPRLRHRRRKGAAGVSTPTSFDMHVRADTVAQFLANGSQQLKGLLMRGSNSRNNSEASEAADYVQFRELSEAVIGQADDPIEGAVRWMRKLMRNES